MSNSNNPKVILMASVALMMAAAGAAGYVMMAASPEPEPPTAMATAPAEPARVEPIRPAVDPPAIEPTPTPEREDAPRASERDRRARDLEREQIWAALGREHNLEPAGPGSAAPSESAAALLPTLDPEYIKSTIGEQLVPVALECYESALEDEPELAGELVMKFTIVGAEEVGGVVEEAEVGEDSTLENTFVRDCMRESLLAVTFEPPPDGGRVEVTYPFEFAPE